MDSTRLWERISDSADRLTRSEVVIAEGLRGAETEIAFSSASSISSRIGVSEATLVRFARTIGYGSYQELQQDLQNEIRHHLNATTLERFKQHRPDGSPVADVFRQSVKLDLQNVEDAFGQITGESIERAVSLLIRSRKRFVVGMRASAGAAHFAACMLGYLLENVQLLSAPYDGQIGNLLDLGVDDALVVISLARPSKRTVEITRFCKERGMSIIAISDSLLSPAARLADLPIVVSSESNTYFQSYTAAMSVITGLVSAVASVSSDVLEARLSDAEKLISQFDLHYHS